MKDGSPMWFGIVSVRSTIDGRRLRCVYELARDAAERVGLPTGKITVAGPGFPSAKFRDFKRVRNRFEASDFDRIKRVILSSPRADWDGRGLDSASVNSDILVSQPPTYGRAASWVLFPKASSDPGSSLLKEVLAFGSKSIDDYGYMFSMSDARHAFSYPFALHGTEAVDLPEEKENMGWWGIYDDLVPPTMLRDVHEISFLGRPLLDQPVFDTTLEKWIRADGGRGTIKPFNRTSVMWRVPRENIPAIREELFKAGILFYFRFFQTWEKDNVWARDFSKPFRLPAKVPEIFRASYRRVIDPTPTRHVPDL